MTTKNKSAVEQIDELISAHLMTPLFAMGDREALLRSESAIGALAFAARAFLPEADYRAWLAGWNEALHDLQQYIPAIEQPQEETPEV